MWEATESGDDIAMQSSELRSIAHGLEHKGRDVALGQCREDFHRPFLNVQRFRVLHGHVEEYSLERPEVPVEPVGYATQRPGERRRVLRESRGVPAARTSRTLIEEQYKRETSSGGLCPVIESAGGSGRHYAVETPRDLGVDVVISTKPSAHITVDPGLVSRWRAEPELE